MDITKRRFLQGAAVLLTVPLPVLVSAGTHDPVLVSAGTQDIEFKIVAQEVIQSQKSYSRLIRGIAETAKPLNGEIRSCQFAIEVGDKFSIDEILENNTKPVIQSYFESKLRDGAYSL